MISGSGSGADWDRNREAYLDLLDDRTKSTSVRGNYLSILLYPPEDREDRYRPGNGLRMTDLLEDYNDVVPERKRHNKLENLYGLDIHKIFQNLCILVSVNKANYPAGMEVGGDESQSFYGIVEPVVNWLRDTPPRHTDTEPDGLARYIVGYAAEQIGSSDEDPVENVVVDPKEAYIYGRLCYLRDDPPDDYRTTTRSDIDLYFEDIESCDLFLTKGSIDEVGDRERLEIGVEVEFDDLVSVDTEALDVGMRSVLSFLYKISVSRLDPKWSGGREFTLPSESYSPEEMKSEDRLTAKVSVEAEF